MRPESIIKIGGSVYEKARQNKNNDFKETKQ